MTLTSIRARNRPRRAPRWSRTRVVLAVAAALIVAHLGVRWAILANSYFRQDDFEFVARAAERVPDWGYLMRSHSGQLMPGGFAIAWVLTRISAYNWGLTGAVTLLMQAAAALAVLRMLRVLFGDRPAILAPLAVYLFTPMTITSTAWWAAALNSLPLQAAIGMAVAAHVRYIRTNEFKYARAAFVWTLVGLAFFVKAAVLPFLLLAVTSAYLMDGGGWARGLLATLRTHGRAWALYGAALPVYAVVFAIQLANTSRTSVGAPGGEAINDFASAWLGKTVPTAMVGGPGRWFAGTSGDYAVAAPAQLMIAVAWCVVIGVIGLSIWFRRRAWRAWLILVGWLVAADMVPVILGRMPDWAARIYGIETRYLADAAPVFALCLALACVPLAGEREPYRRQLPEGWLHPSTIGVLTLAYVGVSMWSTVTYLDKTNPDLARDYMANARAALGGAPGSGVIYDRNVPGFMTWQLVGPYAQTSHVLAPLAGPDVRAAMKRRQPAENAVIFNDQGRLVPLAVSGPRVNAVPGRCWPQAGGRYTLPVPPPGKASSWTLDLGYLSGAPGRVRVAYGGPEVEVPLGVGLNKVFVPIEGRGPNVVITPVSAPSGLCVGGVAVGTPVPSR
ncbi:MAG TPA: hypothetical protein VFU43_03270 [Streptosporangiaceae bacterium]|nr:hypothetical protein [Streptosporangiaceae bacterium]